ncbi:MAG: DUF3575 domain-containing protein [bacterium]|jgi:hypothetical protein
MMRKTILFLMLSCFPAMLLFSQQGTDMAKEKYLQKREGVLRPNAIKINSMAILFQNISVSYERAISQRFTAGVGFSYKYAGGGLGLLNVDSKKIDLYTEPINGFSVTPEARWYARKCESQVMEGFYIGLYLRFTRYNTGLKFDYYPDEGEPFRYNSTLKVGENGVGFQIGYQLVLWKRLTIDLMFMGPRYSNYHLGYEFDQVVSDEFLQDLSDYLNDVINRFGMDYTVELKQSGERRASHTFSFANIRFGIGIGYSF